jgi:lysozyme
MKLSENGIDLLIEREGVRKRAYQDTKDVWTIGVGHTGPEVYDGLYWTDDQCRDVFKRDVARFEDSVNACVKVPLKQHEFDALVSFAFNCGEAALPHGGANGGPSSILAAINRGDMAGAANAFNNWMADASVRTRRAGEREQFAGRHFQARYP